MCRPDPRRIHGEAGSGARRARMWDQGPIPIPAPIWYRPQMVKSRPRIAVVDDDPSVRKALARLLRASDLDADTYASAQDFLASLPHATQLDCLVLDLQMPGTSGLDLQRQLVRAGRQLPVVVITGHDEPGMQARCLAAGARAYLRKPLEAGALLAAIEAAIAHAP
ncbi:MAG TPA: response regulator [Geminicoccaceae bacterium]|nr:response regulator [Geminicoccaceae bacterium]